MRDIKTKGLVVREVAVGEADKIITIFTKNGGKISASAKGARKPKSPFVAGTQIFAYCDFVFYRNKNYINIAQMEVIETFHGIREDVLKLSYGMYMMELLDTVTSEEEPNEDLLRLALKAFAMLSRTEQNPKLITRIYELKLMAFSGYSPEIMTCAHCGKTKEEYSRFSSKTGGVLCNECLQIDPYSNKISKSSLYTIQYILSADFPKLFQFTLSEEVLDELSKITKSFISYHLERKFKTLDFLEQIEATAY